MGVTKFPVTINRTTGELYSGIQSSTIPIYSHRRSDFLFIGDQDGALLNAIDPTAELDLIDSEPAYVCSRLEVTSVPTLLVDPKYTGTQVLTSSLQDFASGVSTQVIQFTLSESL